MSRPKRYWLTFIYTIPADLIAWIIVMVLWLFWGTSLHWEEGLWFEFKTGSWPMRTWYSRWGGTTLGHGGMLAHGEAGRKGIDTGTEVHEHVHQEQFEVAMLVSFFFGGVVTAAGYWLSWEHSLVIGGLIWLSGGAALYLSSVIQAWLRGENPYEGSTLEEAAYSLTEQWERKNRG